MKKGICFYGKYLFSLIVCFKTYNIAIITRIALVSEDSASNHGGGGESNRSRAQLGE